MKGKNYMFKLLKKISEYFVNKSEIKNYVYYINGNDTLPPPLSKEEEDELFKRYEKGDQDARNKLIIHNLRLVVYVAKRYEVNSCYLEDLISIGCLGLIKAISTFKAEKNFKLATYASRCIENEILMYLRKKSKQKIEVSIDEPLNIDYDGNELLLSDILSNSDDCFINDMEDNERKKIMYEAIKDLKKREKEIITMRYGLDNGIEMTQKDVAETLNISQSYISRLEKRIIKKLKAKVSK